MQVLYSQKRHEMKTGDIIAWNKVIITSFFDFILFLYQKILKANFTHVGVVVVMGDRYFILEATPPMVRLYPISLTDDFYYLPLDLPDNSTHLDILFKKIGVKYSIIDAITSMFSLSNNPSTEYCSELAGKYYNDIGYIYDSKAGLVPDTLMKALIEQSGKELIFIKNDRGNLNAV